MSKIKRNNEKFRWMFQRITGMQLFICFGIHIWVFLFRLDRPIEFAAIQAIFSQPVWIVFYTIFIALAVYHGFSGLWTVLTDKNPSKTYKRNWKIVLYVLGALIVGLSCWNFILLGVL
jgi:succinate dehydrogenase cytochrome b556 subunit